MIKKATTKKNRTTGVISCRSSATIEENGWILVPSRYIEFVDRDNELDFNAVLADAGAKVKNLLIRQEENRQSLINAFNAIGYNVK